MYHRTSVYQPTNITLLLLYAVFVQASLYGNFTGSGDSSLTPACEPPDSPPYLVNTTDEEYTSLVHEGRCYLICLLDEFEGDVEVIPYKSWKFAKLRNTADCQIVSKLRECTRGCKLNLDDPDIPIDHCRSDCENDCLECGNRSSCINPDSNDLWSPNTSCSNNCVLNCSGGCQYGKQAVENTIRLKIPSLPDAPVIYKQLNDAGGRRLVSVELPDTTGMEEAYTGFLFQIQDTLSGNVTYIWQHDPREDLNLTNYLCRDIEVSLSLFNRHGQTNFTDPVHLYFKNDLELPEAPRLIHISEELDGSYFQHVILTITWNSPQNDTYLMSFLVELQPDAKCISSGMDLEATMPYNSVNSTYSMTFKVNQTGIIGCTYDIMIFSVGKHGKAPADTVQYTVKGSTVMINISVTEDNRGTESISMMSSSSVTEADESTESISVSSIVTVDDNEGPTNSATVRHSLHGMLLGFISLLTIWYN